jgi:glycosyltransferase involved in cell wall biosynthesis
VVTLHDLIPIKHPETEKFAAQMYWRLQIPIAAKRSDFIITDSEFARQEIMADFNVLAERIKATMLGFNPAMLETRDAVEGMAIRSQYNLPDSYILYVGTIQPRKNICSLIEAYARLSEGRKMMPRLVIVGRKGWLFDRLFERISDLGLTDEVIFTGFVPDKDLPFIYDGASVFAYLSLFEGFGLPPLEAMACGVPVVVSNTTSLPEVVGDAGFLVMPTDIDAIAAALRTMLDNFEIVETMSKKGLARARTFSWERCAQETLEIYSAVISNGMGKFR